MLGDREFRVLRHHHLPNIERVFAHVPRFVQSEAGHVVARGGVQIGDAIARRFYGRGREKRRTGDHLPRNVPLQCVEIDELAERPGAAPNDGFGTHIDLEKNGDGSDTENREREGDFMFCHRV